MLRIRLLWISVILLFFYSCQKSPDLKPQNYLKHHLESEDDPLIKKGQAVEIFDETLLDDSAKFVNPPTDKFYEWKSIPDNGCVTFSGKYKNGKAVITFHCSGKYQLFANIYDSATKNLIGLTDTMTIEVNNDSLYRSQAIKSDDILNLKPSIVKTWIYPHNLNIDPPDEVYIQMVYSTTDKYEYNPAENHIDLTTSIIPGSYSYIFSDSVKLFSYPFSNGNYIFSPVQGSIDLKGLTVGVPANLTIGWLGKTNTVKVTLINNNQYSFQSGNIVNIKIN